MTNVKSNRPRRIRSVAICTAILILSNAPTVLSAPGETPENVLAAKVRQQGHRCEGPVAAEKDQKRSKADRAVWTVSCKNAAYRVHLVPDMAAQIQKIGPNR